MDVDEIVSLLREEGAKRGFSADQINKTIKQIKKGKINLESLAPMLANKFTNNFASSETPTRAELQQRLANKIKDSRVARAGKASALKNKNNDGETKDQEHNAQTKSNSNSKSKPKSKSKSDKKRLNKIAKKYGEIASETYIESITYIKQLSTKEGNLTEAEVLEKNRHNNIIKIYEKQTTNETFVINKFDDDADDDVEVNFDI
jgi:hypothetical protein